MIVFGFLTSFVVVLTFLVLGTAQLSYSMYDLYRSKRWVRPVVGTISGGLLIIIGTQSLFNYFFYG